MDDKIKKIQSRIWFFSLKESENNIPLSIEKLKESGAEEVYFIKHDKDTYFTEDTHEEKLKDLHYHFLIKYKSPCVISTIQKIFDIDDAHINLINKCKSWKYSCRYFLHLDDKDKFPYSVENVQIIKGSIDKYLKYISGEIVVKNNELDMFPFFGNFEKMPYKEQYLQVYNGVENTFTRNRLLKQLDESFNNYLTKKVCEMDKKDVNVMLIEGAEGSGKSTYAISLCVSNKKSYCVSSSSNDALQNYTCEDVLILDDLREDAFKFADLLKLLDNHIMSSVKSRYKNKYFLGDMIIITTKKPLRTWYKDLDDIDETKNQLYRRINLYAYCIKKDNICYSRSYIPTQQDLEKYKTTGNTALDTNGYPITTNYLEMPIIELSARQVDSIEALWKNLGLKIDFKTAQLDMFKDLKDTTT